MRLLKVPWKESAGGVYDTDSWQYNLVTREKGNHQKPVFNTRRWNKFHRKREDLESFSLVYISFGTCKIRRLNPAYITEGNEKKLNSLCWACNNLLNRCNQPFLLGTVPNTIYYQCYSRAFLTQQTYETWNSVWVSKEHSCLLPTDVFRICRWYDCTPRKNGKTSLNIGWGRKGPNEIPDNFLGWCFVHVLRRIVMLHLQLKTQKIYDYNYLKQLSSFPLYNSENVRPQ